MIRAGNLSNFKTQEHIGTAASALLWSALYSAEWKLGPISEASIGNTGRFLILNKSDNRLTTETGTVGLVVTPVGGWIWSMAEDVMDEHVIVRLERKSKNPLYLFSIQFLNPCRGFSNLLRFKALGIVTAGLSAVPLKSGLHDDCAELLTAQSCTDSNKSTTPIHLK